jgi:hypothetical protein
MASLAPAGGLRRILELGRARIVTENEGSERRAVSTGMPMLLVACGSGEEGIEAGGGTYADDDDVA